MSVSDLYPYIIYPDYEVWGKIKEMGLFFKNNIKINFEKITRYGQVACILKYDFLLRNHIIEYNFRIS